ncbi:poly(rC)-binding protein 3 isoform X1 [Anopheles funestus]|uniref:K Homology domain-containing protein n=1 Tax=Anopheles funestus TaxID=62324 RepID=A0A4Y0BLG6_ANOFN|nr:poly(rC)-binding protein 3 isoform X1 [Anopheles funestus]XP_049297032.1 poly(rC)-binding protein 3 isoform X1 [Anopheles funestus]XP_049297033.1 poly(rC)-binding protein 3 isoform X1 [Anopheles funestus]XP_049297034.1 poly(rC)-binding protein 3 isoform X1 [Anopheles funestus]XP_049297035.1 poly(rC)-binding protein 3 isoform X1 [Anopheles funestus]XP_049297036.1 poly(rC)-binding protein 3 isoform X1 [Anopheles funestus]XP_049297037.1 poly(rC)-binding protein 3 isoform X1 [Anopheles funestu
MEDNKMVKIGDINLSDDSAVTLTIRLIMQGKEVGSIIGKKGEIVKRFREESGAKINISDCSCPERIVTVSGTRSAIYKAFTLITKKFEEWCSQFQDNTNTQGKPQIPIRLIVPASQCGSLIGKGGSKIKEIREITGCSIQVASEMLPNSTERAVTLSGSAEAITQCIYHICCVMLESPPKGATIPYRPKPQVNGPVIVANGQAYTIQGNYAVPAQETCTVYPLAITGGLHAGISGLADPLLKGTHLQGAIPPHHLQPIPDVSGIAKNPLAGLAALGLAGAIPSNTGGLNPTALAALAGSQLRTNNNRNVAPVQSQSHEMTVPNDLIGCIIGKGGTKIAEIRQISGAMIRISNCEERDSGNTDRTITITGNPDSVALAQYLINMSVELQKANLGDEAGAAAAATAQVTGVQPATAGIVPPSAAATLTAAASAAAAAAANTGVAGAGATGANAAAAAAAVTNPLATAIPLAQLLAKPGTLNALNSLSALGSLTDLLGNLSSGAAAVAPIQTTGVNRPKTTRMRSPNTNNSMNGDSSKKSERNKFSPY